MHMFTENLNTITSHHADEIGDAILSTSLPPDRKALMTEGGVVYFRQQIDGRWISLSSAYDPKEEAGRLCTQVLQNEDQGVAIHFVLGEAGLYHLEEILSRVSMNAIVVFVSNRPDYFRLVLEYRDVRSALQDQRLILAVSSDSEWLKQFVHALITRHPKKMPTFAIFEHPVEAKIQETFIQEIKRQIAWVYRTLVVNFNTSARFEDHWAENFMLNLPYFLGAKVTDDLRGSWREKPVIIVGAGPSLEKNVNILREAKGKALIFCVDTAYRILRKHGIHPDVIVTIDGSPANSRHLAGLDYSDAPLLADYYARYDILQNHKNSKILLDTVEFHTTWWEYISSETPVANNMPSGGSVATVAFGFAKLIGANPIILTGIDLSYPGGKYYADGAVNSDQTVDDIRKYRRLIELTDIEGKPVYTTEDYFYYLSWFEREAEFGDRLYINASEGGVLKNNFVVMSLQEVLSRYCDVTQDVEGWSRNVTKEPLAEEQIYKIYQNLRKSYLESRALVRYSAILIKRLYEFLQQTKLHHYAELPQTTASIQKGYEKLTQLKLGLSFLNGQSVKVAWRDSLLETVLDQGRSELARDEVAIASANRTLDLFRNFYQLAEKSVRLHRRGMATFSRYFKLKEASLHGYES